MDFEEITYFLIRILSILRVCSGIKRDLRFEIQPNANNLDGMACAMETFDIARGAKFDPITGACTTLTDDWISSPTFDGISNYFTLVSVKRTIEKNDTVKMDFLSNFVVGGSVILYMTTETVGTTNAFIIRLNNKAETIFGFYVSLRESENVFICNSWMNGVWGAEERKTNPFKTSNKVYKLEFEITSIQVKIYIDDIHFHSFNHRTSVDNYQVVYFYSQFSTVDQLEFTYQS